MRRLLFLSVPVLFYLAACAGVPNVVTAPSTAPIRGKIQSARESVARAQTHAGKAKAAIETSKKLAQSASPARTIPDLSVALDLANSEVDALTQELVTTQAALSASDLTAIDLQKQIDSLAEFSNAKIKENNALALDRDATRKKYHTVKFYLCTAAAAVAALLAFQFRSLLALLGPYGLIAGLAGLPALVFGALWFYL